MVKSDNPVIKLNYLNQNEYDLKGGWGKEKGNIIFPIGPDHPNSHIEPRRWF